MFASLSLNTTLKMSWIQTDAKMFKFALSLLVESNESKKALRLKGFCPLKPFSTILTWLVIGVALALPVAFYIAIGNVHQLSGKFDGNGT